MDSYGARLNIFYSPQYFALYRIQPGSLTLQDRPLRREEIYRIVAENGDLRLHTLWCWVEWKLYLVDQRMNTNFFRPITRLANDLLGRISGGRIWS